MELIIGAGITLLSQALSLVNLALKAKAQPLDAKEIEAEIRKIMSRSLSWDAEEIAAAKPPGAITGASTR